MRLYVSYSCSKRLVWTHNLLAQVIQVAARCMHGSGITETVNKRVASPGLNVYLEQSNGSTNPNLARVRLSNNA